jgi:hypothetical protein
MKPNALEGPEVIGMLARTVPTRLIDICRTGCLLESGQPVEDGTVGELRLQVHRDTFVDDVRVTRCVQVEGSGSMYLVGAEFVQTHRPGEWSIRRAVTGILRRLATTGPISVPDPRTLASDSGDGDSGAAPTIVNSVHSTGEETS